LRNLLEETSRKGSRGLPDVEAKASNLPALLFSELFASLVKVSSKAQHMLAIEDVCSKITRKYDRISRTLAGLPTF
jgi:hypothetical protein